MISRDGRRPVFDHRQRSIWTVNPGDRIAQRSQSIEEKSKQLAVDAPDITGDHIQVPTYFVVEYPDGEKQALHHVRDAQKISDIIRQIKLDLLNSGQGLEDVSPSSFHNFNGLIWVFCIALLLVTAPILIGLF